MALRIIKPPHPGKLFVTLAPTGYLFFSTRAVVELNISENKGIVLAADERGNLYLKTTDKDDPDGFRVYVRKNGAASVTCIHLSPLTRRLGIKVTKSTRYNLVEGNEDNYKIDGLKIKS